MHPRWSKNTPQNKYSMRKIILAVAAFLALSSCDSTPRAKDGYYFENGTKTERSIRFVTYTSMDDVKRAYATTKGARKLGPNEDLQAFALVSPTTCTVHMIDPAVSYKPEWIGHEITHCLYGEFHPNQIER